MKTQTRSNSQEAKPTTERFTPRESEGHVDERILQAVRSLDYGSVEVVIHGAKVVQIERREKVRVETTADHSGSLASAPPAASATAPTAARRPRTRRTLSLQATTPRGYQDYTS
jgi:hypothetical protein